MAIAVEFNVPGMTRQQYDETMRRLAEEGLATPAGRSYHLASPDDDGWFVFDVWESERQLNEFAQQLMPILASVGVEPPTPRTRPIHNVIS